ILDDEGLPGSLVGLTQVPGQVVHLGGFQLGEVRSEDPPRVSAVSPAVGAKADTHEDVGPEGHLKQLMENRRLGQIGKAVDGPRSKILPRIVARVVLGSHRDGDHGGTYILNLLNAILQRRKNAHRVRGTPVVDPETLFGWCRCRY